MEILSFSLSDQGKVRKNNEDLLINMPECNLFAVADGMGGEKYGEIASEIAIETIKYVVKNNMDLIKEFEHNPTPENKNEILKILDFAVKNANKIIYEKAEELKTPGRMGTTLTVFLASGDTGFMVHAGDSRLYLVRHKEVSLISTDHNIKTEYKEKYGETEVDPTIAELLTKAVGINQFIEPELMCFSIAPQDRFLLCTDGLHRYFSDNDKKEMYEKLASQRMNAKNEQKFIENAGKELLDFVYEKGAEDNVSFIILSIIKTSEDDERKNTVGVFEILQQTPLFANLTYKELLFFTEKAEFRTVKKYDIVFQNRNNPEILIIIKGKVSAMKKDIVLKTFYPKDHIGEVSFLTESKLNFHLFAEETSTFLVLKKDKFLDLINNYPEIGVKLLFNTSVILSNQLVTSIELIEK